MPTLPLVYPLINGSLFSWSSVEFKPNGIPFRGFKSINYKRTRDRPKVWGNHPDPLGKVVGKNDYTCDAEIYLAEWLVLLTSLSLQGPGWGDQFFPIFVSYKQNAFTTIQDVILGATVDEVDASQQEGTDPLVRKVTFNPVKILFNGIDDVQVPLVVPPF